MATFDMATGDKFGKDLAEALGLENCTNIEIKVALGQVVEIKATQFLTNEQAKEIVLVLKKYKFTPIEDEQVELKDA